MSISLIKLAVSAIRCLSAREVCHAPKCELPVTITGCFNSRANWKIAVVFPPEPTKAMLCGESIRSACANVKLMPGLYIFHFSNSQGTV